MSMSTRLYPVGRLDKDTHGIILITNDGRLPNSSLRSKFRKQKIYEVTVDDDVTEDDLEQLRDGVTITTTSQRDRKSTTLTAPTLPCTALRLSARSFTITITEGRNRQIRKMCGALGLGVVDLRRVEFMGIKGDDLRVGEWRELTDSEMLIVNKAVQDGEEVTTRGGEGLRCWSEVDVIEWMESVGYGACVEAFKKSGVDGGRLLNMGTPDQVDHLAYHLEDMGVEEEDREGLERAIVELCEEEG
ncbi:hypothetical protein TrCOL_g5107 [Triparma columacea]|uniref:SAM domain-containing protein n=1 Tax=Triparma columacea TaxID=722753 RepID=A0A9W7GRY3_9STRA|nr:hypothetical protein TrCOL_g5107 [Triparma columacea]